MKKHFAPLLLALILAFSSPSFSEWTAVAASAETRVYVDFERIRKIDGYLYIWDLTEYFKPDEYGVMSAKGYRQADCKLFRFKWLSVSFHKDPMGGGINELKNPIKKTQDWEYASPNSLDEIILNKVCSR
mgnify:CR=1 FL=1